MNFDHLDKVNERIPDLFMQRILEKQEAGLKACAQFEIKRTIQSIFDIRRSLTILQDVFLHQTPFHQYFA